MNIELIISLLIVFIMSISCIIDIVKWIYKNAKKVIIKIFNISENADTSMHKKREKEECKDIYNNIKEERKLRSSRNKIQDSEEIEEEKPHGSFLKGVIPVVICAGVLCCMFKSFYRVSEQEQAVVTRFGKVNDIKTAGMYFKVPFVDKVQKVNTTTYGMPIGYTITNEHEGENPDYESTSDSLMITSDFNLVNTDFYLEYKVSDPVKYLYNSSKPERFIQNMASAAIRGVISDFTVDDVMTTEKSKIQATVRDQLTKSLQSADIGIEIVNLSIQDVEPPTNEVIAKFKSVETAKQAADTTINKAKQYKSEQIPAAEASADSIIQKAEAAKEARIAEAEGEVAKFNKMYEQYTLNPLITKKRIFYEAMEDVLPDLNVIISDGTTETMMPLQPFSEITTNGGEN